MNEVRKGACRHVSGALVLVNSAKLGHKISAALSNRAMKVVEQVRRERLQELRERYGTLAELNRKLDRPDRDATLGQYLNPTKGTKSDKIKGMGSSVARDIEDKLGLEPGWMDNDPDLFNDKQIHGAVSAGAAESRVTSSTNDAAALPQPGTSIDDAMRTIVDAIDGIDEITRAQIKPMLVMLVDALPQKRGDIARRLVKLLTEQVPFAEVGEQLAPGVMRAQFKIGGGSDGAGNLIRQRRRAAGDRGTPTRAGRKG